MSVRKASKGPVKNAAEEEEKEDDVNSMKKRSAKFSQLETDLLCSLWVTSTLNTNATSKLTRYGKHGLLSGWSGVATVFNASLGVSHRPVSVLKERAHNIRKDLNKLASFTLATSEGNFPSKKPPKVSFELSDAVKEYATQLQIKLDGLQPTSTDSKSSTKSQFVASVKNNAAVESPQPPTPQEKLESWPIVATSTAAPIDAITTTATVSTIDVPSTSTGIGLSSTLPRSTPAGNLIRQSKQFLATQKQRTRKRNNNAVMMPMVHNDSSSQSSSHSSEIRRDKYKYYEKKTTLIIDENARRAEWHAICMDIKKEELAIKRKQAQLWDKAISVLRTNTATIADIVNVATSIQKSECPVEYCNDYPARKLPNDDDEADVFF